MLIALQMQTLQLLMTAEASESVHKVDLPNIVHCCPDSQKEGAKESSGGRGHIGGVYIGPICEFGLEQASIGLYYERLA